MNKKLNDRDIAKEALILTVAVAIIAATVYFFLAPSHTSVSSISGLGIVLSNFVPLPLSASRGDQIQNARYFEKKGYAIMVDQDTATADTLADAVAHLFENRMEYRANMMQDALLDGTDEVLREIRRAAGAEERE